MTYEKCVEIRELLVAFLDDELPCDMSHGIHEHLERCQPCARLAKVESRFTIVLKTRLCRIEAPPEFAAEMRKRLKDPESMAGGARADAATAGFASPRGRVRYALVAAVILTAVAVPTVEILRPGFYRGMTDSLTGVRSADGVLICIECERLGVPIDGQRHCHDAAHHTGLKCPKTGIWSLVVNDASLPVLGDPGKRGAEVTVRGRFHGDIRYIDARSITPATGT
ncbi:MAG TPA: zf-HC2 domain-containing protein [Patescibacteria group bacterium]|jgi:hypothetical protein|nr:zf-HC2 domain-containing protein [Patescibacteria group bacterium]